MLWSSQSAVGFGPVRVAETAWTRTRGLLGYSPLVDNEGMLIMRCHSVHTIGMKYAIDVVFLKTNGKVAKVVEGLRPLRFAGCMGASAALELAAGRARALQLVPGVQLHGWQ